MDSWERRLGRGEGGRRFERYIGDTVGVILGQVGISRDTSHEKYDIRAGYTVPDAHHF